MGERLLAMTVAAATAAATVLPAAASGATVGGFSVSPATFDPAVPSTRAYFQPTIRAGHTFRGQAVVSNVSDAPIVLRVYPVSGVTAVTSGAVYTNHGDSRSGPATWLRPTTALLSVPAKTRLKVSFRVSVPGGTSAGQHLAGLAFENTKPHHAGGRFAITEIVRAVIGIEVRVPGPATAQIRLRGATVRPLPGTHVASVVVPLADAGGLLCKPRLLVSLRQGGRIVGRATRQLDTLLPGDVIPYPFPWPKALTAGDYTTTVHASGCGTPQTLTSSSGLKASLDGTRIKRAAGAAPRPGGGTPIGLIALVGLGGLAIGTAAAWRLSGARRSPSLQP